MNKMDCSSITVHLIKIKKIQRREKDRVKGYWKTACVFRYFFEQESMCPLIDTPKI